MSKRRQVYFLPWVVHRNPLCFDDPEEFRPERWADERMKQVPKYAYFPFSGGPRVCLYRQLIRPDGGGTGAYYSGSEIPPEVSAGPGCGALAGFHVEAEERHKNGTGEERCAFPRHSMTAGAA